MGVNFYSGARLEAPTFERLGYGMGKAWWSPHTLTFSSKFMPIYRNIKQKSSSTITFSITLNFTIKQKMLLILRYVCL